MEELFDKDITVVNKYTDKDKKTQYKLSYVKGFWSSKDGSAINGTQLTKANSLVAKILINDKRNIEYQEPNEFRKEPRTWTLKNDDYLVKGIIDSFTTSIELLENYTDVIKIRGISTKDYGSEDMWHWAITGE